MEPAQGNLLANLRSMLRPVKSTDSKALSALIGGIRKSYGLPSVGPRVMYDSV